MNQHHRLRDSQDVPGVPTFFSAAAQTKLARCLRDGPSTVTGGDSLPTKLDAELPGGMVLETAYQRGVRALEAASPPDRLQAALEVYDRS